MKTKSGTAMSSSLSIVPKKESIDIENTIGPM